MESCHLFIWKLNETSYYLFLHLHSTKSIETNVNSTKLIHVNQILLLLCASLLLSFRLLFDSLRASQIALEKHERVHTNEAYPKATFTLRKRVLWLLFCFCFAYFGNEVLCASLMLFTMTRSQCASRSSPKIYVLNSDISSL